MIKLFAAGMAAALVVAATGARAQAPEADPDWPCVQRLVPNVAVGQMWQGPPPAESELGPALSPLAATLTDRSVPVADVKSRVGAALGSVPAAERPAQLTLLFTTALDNLNTERGRLIEGIRRYARGQRAMAQKITAETARIEDLSGDPAADAEVAELRGAQGWNRRVYDDRQRSLRTLCDQPVALEQRAFAVARELSGLLP